MPLALLRSFWIGGFEGADHVNGHGQPLDMTAANGHYERLDEDYAAAAALGLVTVRESIGWRLAEPEPGRWDFERALRMAQAARRQGVQILWSLMHYGLPPDLDLRDDALIERFAAFARTVARTLAPLAEEPPIYTPINEIGFLAWAASQTRLIWPYRHEGEGSLRSGYEIKRRLVRAALAGMEAMRAEDPRCRFLHIEPLVHVVAPLDRPDLAPLAEQIDAYQWQAWDLLCGRREGALGGHPAALDLLGANLYASGQWECVTERRIDWRGDDPRRRAPALLLGDAWQRYRRPLLVAETSHVGDGRAEWLDAMAGEVQAARAAGTPVEGLCLYPLVDRPDWNDPGHWHRSGLFDVLPPDDPARPRDDATRWRRFLQPESAAALMRWRSRLPAADDDNDDNDDNRTTMDTLLVISHLRWNFVFQRPQHLMTRLARRFRVLFVEEPVRTDGPARIEVSQAAPGVELLVPHTPIDGSPGFHERQLPTLARLLQEHLCAEGIADPLLWLVTPQPLPLAQALKPGLLVYDAMDELSAFKGAPPGLMQREATLMKDADLVLTGGPSLYEARRERHANVHCLPSAVDPAHFAPARLIDASHEAQVARALHHGIARPLLGFYGVVDERLDVELVAALADARPQWQIVMVGPVAKIDAATLPQRPNLHWRGMQPYAVLPYLSAQWDVCLLPFALNEATRFISPTKTLEYMAADKPVVSTAVHDVQQLYGSVVRIGHDRDAFIAHCEAALAESARARAARVQAMRELVARSTWDDAAAKVMRLIDAALEPFEEERAAVAAVAGALVH
jgi:UDP-galactopyranose mutase